MRLYYSPGACSLAPHIALEEAEADFEPTRVLTSAGEHRMPEYLAVNAKGRVPALSDGPWHLTEVPAILRYIARMYPKAALWPIDVKEEARCMEWLAWTSSTIHVAFSQVTRPERYAETEARDSVMRAGKRNCFDLAAQIEARLRETGPWALGDRYSVADAYLFVYWRAAPSERFGIDLETECPAWWTHGKRMNQRPAVRRALAREGLE